MQTVAAATCSSAAAAAAFWHAAVFAEGTGVSTITALQKRLFIQLFAMFCPEPVLANVQVLV